MIAPRTLDYQVDLSLQERCRAFEVQFPRTKLSIYHLRKFYREAGIRKKKIRKTKLINEIKQIEINEQAVVANNKIQDLEQRGYRLIYIDEMCVTKSTIPTHAYSPLRRPIEIDLKNFSNKTVAVLAGISKQKGMELVM